MNPFLAILRPAIQRLRGDQPEARQEIYERSRIVIRDRMRLIDPPPSAKAITSQMLKLEAAIDEIEKTYGARR